MPFAAQTLIARRKRAPGSALPSEAPAAQIATLTAALPAASAAARKYLQEQAVSARMAQRARSGAFCAYPCVGEHFDDICTLTGPGTSKPVN
jgi:hypothetical protein